MVRVSVVERSGRHALPFVPVSYKMDYDQGVSCLSRALAGYPVFWHSGRKSACRDGVDLVSRWVLYASDA